MLLSMIDLMKLFKIKNTININELNINYTIDEILAKIFENPNISSKRWIWEQYDSSVMGDTISSNGKSDASIVKIHGTENSKSPWQRNCHDN